MISTTEQTLVSYETLHSGAIVSIQLPKNVTFKQVKDDNDVVAEYLHWAVPLSGGLVNLHVHSADIALANTTVRARVEVKVKTTSGGRRFVFVDLYPIDKAERPTHRLVIINDTFDKKDDWLVFPAPNLRGYVALIGPDEKLVQLPAKYREGKTTVVGKQRRAPSVPSSAQPIAGNRPFADAFAK